MKTESEKHYHETGKALHKKVTDFKAEYTFLKLVDSLALANTMLQFYTARDNVIKGKTKHINFRKKGKDDRYTTNNQNGSIRLVKEDGYTKLKLPKVGTVIIKLYRQIGKNELIKSVTVTLKAGRFYASILVEYDKEPAIPVNPATITEDKVLGIDYSSPLFYVDSNGYSPPITHYFRRSEPKLAKEQRKLAKKKYRSKNYFKQLKKVQRVHEHIANQRKDFVYKEAHRLTEAYDLLCFEDLNLSNLKRTLKLGKATSDNGFGFFRTQVERKCREKGKLFVKIDKWYPSSKLCSKCGTRNPDLKLSNREWVCPECGCVVSRDVNAAINIREEGLRLAKEAAA